MKSVFLTLVAFFVSVVLSEENKCPHVSLQNDVDLSLIDGKWRQIFYTNGSFYKDAVCYHLHVDSKNTTSGNSIKLTYHFSTKLPRSRREYMEGVTEINAGKGEVEKEEDEDHHEEGGEELHLFRNHIATDYTTYMVLYTCNAETGEPLFDIQIRQEKRALGRAARAEINAILSMFGTHLRKMPRVSKRRCPGD